MTTYRFKIVLRKSRPCSFPGFDECLLKGSFLFQTARNQWKGFLSVVHVKPNKPPDISTLRLRITDIRQQPLDINKMTQHQTPIPVEPLIDHWLTIWRARLLVCRGKWVAKIMILLLDLASQRFADTFFLQSCEVVEKRGISKYIYIYHTHIYIYVPVLHVSRSPPIIMVPK